LVSVIIPTLNAAATLAGTLEALREGALPGEIIVVDGGSSDATLAVAKSTGARILTAPRGRGSQLAAGAAAASGEWLLFLHADCRLQPGWAEALRAFMSAPGAEGRAGRAGRASRAGRAGYFDLLLDDPNPAARRLERLVAWRSRVLALPYGDQGLLLSRALYASVGGFRPLPLMEDVDLVRRLGRARLARIGTPILASARRYRAEGYVLRPLRNLFCVSLYFLGIPAHRIAPLYGAAGEATRRADAG
jgi:rSAM/selenodomain-associated transferase 2